MLTWIMFLKFLDDMESIAEQEAQMAGKRFRPALESPYRWRDWAAKQDGITGDELISFVNNEEAVRPDGKKGPGLFAYLRGLQGANGGDRRDVIATVFKGTINRMINGYLLRDVINKVSDIHLRQNQREQVCEKYHYRKTESRAPDMRPQDPPRSVVESTEQCHPLGLAGLFLKFSRTPQSLVAATLFAVAYVSYASL